MRFALSPSSTLPDVSCQIDPKDLALVSRFKWKALKVSPHNHYPYAVSWQLGRILFMHRLIMNPLKGFDIDHLNCDGLDNRRKNLRICTRSDNAHNSRGWAKKTLGNTGLKFKGVWKSSVGHTWEAKICWQSKQRFIGTFKDPILAAQAYDQEARIHHGSFARLNFPQPGEQGLR